MKRFVNIILDMVGMGVWITAIWAAGSFVAGTVHVDEWSIAGRFVVMIFALAGAPLAKGFFETSKGRRRRVIGSLNVELLIALKEAESLMSERIPFQIAADAKHPYSKLLMVREAIVKAESK